MCVCLPVFERVHTFIFMYVNIFNFLWKIFLKKKNSRLHFDNHETKLAIASTKYELEALVCVLISLNILPMNSK